MLKPVIRPTWVAYASTVQAGADSRIHRRIYIRRKSAENNSAKRIRGFILFRWKFAENQLYEYYVDLLVWKSLQFAT